MAAAMRAVLDTNILLAANRSGHPTAMIREHGLSSLTRAPFNTSEFLFVF